MKRKSKMKSQKEDGDNSCDHVIIQKLTKNNIRNKGTRSCCLNKKRKSSEDAEEVEDGSKSLELRRLFGRNYE
jgi:hypothetical protein